MAGRPTDYSEEIAEEICEAIAVGGALYRMCEEIDHWPAERTVYQWLEKHQGFAQKYARARDRQSDRHAELALSEALEATDASLGRLRWDARRWHASKLAPKKYGDKVQQEITGKDGGPIETKGEVTLDTARKLAFLLAKAGKASEVK